MLARPPGAQQGRQQGTKQTIKLPTPHQTNKQKCALFLKHFSCFNTGCQKEGQNEPRGLPKWSPKRPPGPPGRVKSRWEISPEAPRKIAMNFFSPPGGSGSALGISRGGSWSPLGAQEGPGGLQEPFWHHFWSQNGAPRLHFSSFFGHLGALFSSPAPFALSGLASMLLLGVCLGTFPFFFFPPCAFRSRPKSCQKWSPET